MSRLSELLGALGLAAVGLACQDLSGARQPPLTAPFEDSEARTAILDALPTVWSLYEARPDELPWGHFNTGHGGELLVLVGPRPADLLWRSGDEPWRRAPVARESLELWILPGGYRPAPRPPNEHHPHVPAVEVFKGKSATVYGRISHVITAQEEFESLLSQASSTSWSDIPNKSLSWGTWRLDLSRALREHDRDAP